jgi:hypothetical protein
MFCKQIVTKGLIVLHRLIREGDISILDGMTYHMNTLRILSRFADMSDGIAHNQSSFIRTYSTYLAMRVRNII